MRSQKLPYTILICLPLLLSAGCTEPGETTSIGAATGGVIGAGLGAIVGNQTGNAGAGLAIGAVAGAGAGAAIANSLEAQQKAIRTQDEALERQQKILAAQNAEIQELRGIPNDSANSPRGSYGAWNSPSSVRKSGAFRSPSNSSGLSLTDQLNMGADSVPPSAFKTKSTVPDLAVNQPKAIIKPAAREEKKQFASVQTVDLSESKVSAALNEKTIETAPLNKSAKTAESSGAIEDLTTRIAGPEASSKTPECEKADTEAGKAASANEPADKLFYLRRAIKLCPGNASYHKNLGDEYANLGRNEDARTSYEEALKLNPRLSDAKKGLSSLTSNEY